MGSRRGPAVPFSSSETDPDEKEVGRRKSEGLPRIRGGGTFRPLSGITRVLEVEGEGPSVGPTRK